jgi:hypothetical protein
MEGMGMKYEIIIWSDMQGWTPEVGDENEFETEDEARHAMAELAEIWPDAVMDVREIAELDSDKENTMTHGEQAAEMLEVGPKRLRPIPMIPSKERMQIAQAHALVSIAQSLEKLVGAMVREPSREGSDPYVAVQTPSGIW